jgi:hypothetical protein
MIIYPTEQHVEIGNAFLDETNNLGIHNRVTLDARCFLNNARIAF